MRVFCDTSVLVAAALQAHAQYRPCKILLDRIQREEHSGHASAHALAETFAVLSRMPTKPKLSPLDAREIIEHDFLPHFVFVPPQTEDYLLAMRELAQRNLGGGRIYDLLHLHAASRIAVDRIYTLNAAEWKMLAPALAGIIQVP
jgi:predicted nucleic acid-binding protein